MVYDIESWTDMLPEFGGDTYTQTDVYMTGRTNGVATYRNSDFFGLVDGLHFALQYQGNNENAGSGEGTNNGGKRKLARENGDGFGISSYYDLDMGISFGAAYSSSDRTHNQLAAARSSQRYANGDKADAWTVGAKYDANNIYLAAMYAETRNMTFYGNDSLAELPTKRRTSKWSRSISSTTLIYRCVRPWPICSRRVKISTPILATATRIWSSMSTWA